MTPSDLDRRTLLTRRGLLRAPRSRRLVAALLVCAAPLALASSGCMTPSAGAAAQNARGVERFTAGDYDEAISYFQRSIDENPNSAETYYNLGSAYQRKAAATGDLNLLTEAENAYWTALESNPAPDTIVCCYRGLATSSVARGDADSAMSILEEWSERNPESIDPKLEIAYLLEAQDKNKEAYEKLREVAEVAPNDYRPLYKMGVLAQRSGDLNDALAQTNAALKLNPNNDEVVRLARDLRTQYANARTAAKPETNLDDANGKEEKSAVAANTVINGVPQEVATTSAQAENEQAPELVLPNESNANSENNDGNSSKTGVGAPSVTPSPLTDATSAPLGFGDIASSSPSSSSAVGAEFADTPTPFGAATVSKRVADDSDVKWISAPTVSARQNEQDVPFEAAKPSPIAQTSALEPRSVQTATSPLTVDAQSVPRSTATGPVFAPVEKPTEENALPTLVQTQSSVPQAQNAQVGQAVAQVGAAPVKEKTFQEQKKDEQEKVRKTMASFSNGAPTARSGSFF